MERIHCWGSQLRRLPVRWGRQLLEWYQDKKQKCFNYKMNFMQFYSEPIQQDQWYVIYTIPRNEKKVYSELSKRAVEVFLPLQKVVRQWGTRKQKLEVPLFPNYLFISASKAMLWSVLSVKGVVRFISFNGAPAIISNTQMEVIKKIISNDGEVSDRSLFATGDHVRVKNGPFAGLEGKVLDVKGRIRFFIEFEQINQILSIDISGALLEKVTVC